ncbi:isochorismate synthase [Streptomyces enissocaesilis]|uniref:isochorismate synthase n=1 Tax=Streptomyces enissocaesilis TaxID=332589 RepID=A0ABP6JQQ5_9ACTN
MNQTTPVRPDMFCPLLDDYRCGDFFFGTAHGRLLARDTLARIRRPVDAQLAAEVTTSLRTAREGGHDNPVAVGALPFHAGQDSNLHIPLTVARSAAAGIAPAPRPTGRGVLAVSRLPEPEQYAAGVARAVAAIRAGHARKIVLARALDITPADPVDPAEVLAHLVHHDPHAFGFAVSVTPRDTTSAHRTLVGASPELLLSRRGKHVVSHPLAGSIPRSPDPREDKARAQSLQASAKDHDEHSHVTEGIAAALLPHCRKLHVPAAPSVVRTATMWHLATRITAELRSPDTSSLDLALALHPTPAVCGSPLAAAHAVIAASEPFDRGLYTGMVGWCDESGDGEWAVTIRCAEINHRNVRLFAGAGIVADSCPESELAETSAKFQTMLNALGLPNTL